MIYLCMITLDPSEKALFLSNIKSAVAPRPIAFASTVNAAGVVNLSPFSYFNLFGTEPPVVVFSPNRRARDGFQKHTYLNLLEVPETVINLVDYAMVQQASLASCEYPAGTNEFIKAGLTEIPSDLVRPPRVAEAPVQLECKVLKIESVGDANLVIAEVIRMHIADELLDERGIIDQRKTDWVARLGADWYSRASAGLFEVPKPARNLGIGFDQLPENVRNSTILTGNELGMLANAERLPEPEEVQAYQLENHIPSSREERHHLARLRLAENKVREAWLVLL
jgi:flavin reductase (DIM6/NTAB) family NADH-FMN oxidoreductase RutF